MVSYREDGIFRHMSSDKTNWVSIVTYNLPPLQEAVCYSASTNSVIRSRTNVCLLPDMQMEQMA